MEAEGNKLFLSPASAPVPRRPPSEPDDPVNLNIRCFLSKIPLGFEAPVEEAGDPVLQAFNVNGYKRVQVFPKRRNELSVYFEALDKCFTLVSDVVYGFLNSHPVVFRKDNDHVPGLTASLFNVV